MPVLVFLIFGALNTIITFVIIAFGLIILVIAIQDDTGICGKFDCGKKSEEIIRKNSTFIAAISLVTYGMTLGMLQS